MYNGLSAQLNNFEKVFFRRNLDFRVCLKRSYDSAHQLVLKLIQLSPNGCNNSLEHQQEPCAC